MCYASMEVPCDQYLVTLCIENIIEIPPARDDDDDNDDNDDDNDNNHDMIVVMIITMYRRDSRSVLKP